MLRYISFVVHALFSGIPDILVSSFYRGCCDTEHNLLEREPYIGSMLHEVLKFP